MTKAIGYGLAAIIIVVVNDREAAAQTTNTASPSVALDRFSPGDAGSGWFALDALDFHGNRHWMVSVMGDEAYRPLVTRSTDGGPTNEVVSNQIQTHLQAAVVMADKFRFGFSLPLVLSETGQGATLNSVDYPTPGAGLGDPRLSATMRVFRDEGRGIVGAAGLQADVPIFFGTKRYGHEESLRLSPHFSVAGSRGRLAYAGRVGLLAHLPREMASELPRGTDFQIAAAAGVRLWRDQILIGPELYGATMLDGDGPFTTRSSPLEALFGGHYYAATGFGAGLAVGTGLVQATGTPPLRVLANLNYLAPVRP